MASQIIILDDEDNSSHPSTPPASPPSNDPEVVSKQQPAPTHITTSPFASAKKEKYVLKAENEKLFAEFVEHCSPMTADCPEVLDFLHTKYNKASPEFLTSVEFRNTLGRCLTRAQAKKSKTFVYINELCTVLKQHAIKKRQKVVSMDTSTSASPSTPQAVSLKNETTGEEDQEKDDMDPSTGEEQPSTSEVQENGEDGADETEKKVKKASRKQIAYLENLLKVYSDEIQRLQQSELSLDELETEDSTYIQEHKLKRKMMKIYAKLCELKECSTLTGRVIEQKIIYRGTRYPEINKTIERYINNPEVSQNPPDFPDILQQVLRANERYKLCLSRKHLNQMAQEAFRETGSRMQERRQLDLFYNFGSHLTDDYVPSADPAIKDPGLLQKLRSNREVAISHLEQEITKYSMKQDDMEENERQKRQERNNKDKANNKSSKVAEKVENELKDDEKQVEEEEEEEDEQEEEEDSDTDIEEEIEASTQQVGPDDENEEDEANEAEEASEGDNKEDQTYDQTANVSGAEADDVKEEDDDDDGSVTDVSDEITSYISLFSDVPSPRESPSQSDLTAALSNGDSENPQEAPDSSNQVSVDAATADETASNRIDAESDESSHEAVAVQQCDAHTTSGGEWSDRTRSSSKRKRAEDTSDKSPVRRYTIISSRDDLRRNMIALRRQFKREATPPQDLVTSSQTTPPPKKNKVNVATQCDPDEIIVLSDTE